MIRFNEYGQGYFYFSEFEKSGTTTTTKSGITKIPVAKHLTDAEYIMFLKVYSSHNSAMGLKEREKYTLSHVTKIERCKREKCLKVYFDNGDWWHYLADGSWY